MTYQQSLDYLYNRLPVFHISGGSAYKPGLENTIRLLDALGNPHLKFKSVHIAGTNGKGSVSHMVAAILQQSGYKTALYTSPHLIDFGERIRINGITIDPEFVVSFVENHRDLVETVQPSFFELSMAMAFDYFAKNQVDIAVIETGLGGRLDSTNILMPILSIITNIGLDHTEFLGDTVEKIAFEKAGIIKPGVPVVIGEYLPDTKPVFIHKATETGSKVILAQDTFPLKWLESAPDQLSFEFRNERYNVGLTGKYQLKNCAAVLAAIDELNQISLTIPSGAIHSGLSEVAQLTGLRGRWEIIDRFPLLIADTAHNVQGMSAVVEQLSRYPVNRLHIIIGMVNDKDIDGVLQILPVNAQYYFTNAQVKRALAASDLQNQAQKYELHGNAFTTLEDAINSAKEQAGPNDLILITGSNFVVGEALAII